MKTTSKTLFRAVLGLLFLLAVLGLWRACSKPATPVPLPPPVVSVPPPAPPTPSSTREEPKKETQAPLIKLPAKPAVPTTSEPIPAPPPIELHKELIPKDITIVRCYYSQEIAPPGSSFGFDINGSGFTSEFQKMIKVDPSAKAIRVKNLRLITANQIHGDLEIGENAQTNFVYPQILIKNLPVFRAPDPFAVVRKGEVLTIIFISMEENGRAGRFRVITNLDDNLARQFRVEASTPGIDISGIEAHLPYAMEGTLRIGPGVPQGAYGMRVFLGTKEIFRREGMIRIVRPNVGRSGLIQGLSSAENFHRPGDTLLFYLHGTGLAPEDINGLSAKINEFEMGKASFTYISPSQVRFNMNCPKTAPLGSYTVSVLGPNHENLYEKSQAFTIVPSNWVAGLQVIPPISPGGKSALKVIGRDFSSEFGKSLRFETDDPGIHISSIQGIEASVLTADIQVDSAVAPGDYLVTLTAGGKIVKPQFGSLIKVNSK